MCATVSPRHVDYFSKPWTQWETPKASPSVRGNRLSRRRLLVAHADPSIAIFIRNIAVKEGYDVAIASTAAEFKRLYRCFEPNAVIMSIAMPDEDGIELIRYLGGHGCPSPVLLTNSGRMMHSYEGTYRKAARVLGRAFGISVTTVESPTDSTRVQAFLATAASRPTHTPVPRCHVQIGPASAEGIGRRRTHL